MRKRNFKLLFISSFIFIVIGVITIIQLPNEREKFEQFLLDDLKSLNLEYKSEKASKIVKDKPEMAGIQDYYATLDPKLKKVPHERLVSAIKETITRKKTKSDFVDRYKWNEVAADMSGRVRSFMIDPNDSEHKKVWAGSVTGGLWYNYNIFRLDSVWHPVSDIWENLSISSIVYDPNNSQIFYVGTGEPQTAVTIYRESSTRGVGIWKTTDAGNTWQLLTSTENFPYISDIIIKDEAGTSVIYAGVVSGTHQGEDHTSSPSDGLYRSNDGGASWNQVLPDITGESVPYSPSDIELAASGRIFVGTYRNIDGNGAATILYSDNGTSWSVYDDYKYIIEANLGGTGSENIPGRTMLASAPSSPNTIYAIIAAGRFTEENWIYYRGRHLLKSIDNGNNWIEKTVPNGNSNDPFWATLAWHALTIEVDPNDENTLYAGGLNIQKSTDGGTNWELKSWWYTDFGFPPYLHADQHCIEFMPGSSDTIFFANDGGVFVTYNGTESDINFTEKNKSLNTLQFYTCNIHPDSAEVDFAGGLQDNGTVHFIGNPVQKDYSSVSGGDGAYCFYNYNDYLITTTYYNWIYISQKTTGFYERKNLIQEFYGSGTFVCPSDYDISNNTFYANAVGFTGVRRDQILRISNVTSVNYSGQYLNVGTGSNVHFSHVKVSKYKSAENAILYLGTQSGGLFRIENAQSTPSSYNIGDAAFPTANVSCIAEGNDENELLVTFSNYGVSSVWYTNDGGLNWTEKESNLPDIPVRWALFDPEDNTKVLLATEVGIWGTNDIYAETVTWEPLNNGFPNVRVDMLQLREWDNTILAATHGRGLFYCDLDGGEAPALSVNNFNINNTLSIDVYPNPSIGNLRLKHDSVYNNVRVSVYNESGSLVKAFHNFDINSEINISDLSDGLYFVKISAGQKSVTKKIILQK